MAKDISVVLNRLLGLNNISPSYDIAQVKLGGGGALINSYLTEGYNIDIDDKGFPRRRKGFDYVFTGSVHSMWSFKEYFLFRQANTLKRLTITATSPLTVSTSTLRSDLTTAYIPMTYLYLEGLVYYSDGISTGIIENGISRAWGGNTEIYSTKVLEPPYPAQLLTYYNSRIYMAVDNNIYYSEPYGYEYFDLRDNYVQFKHRVTLLESVSDGIWVATVNKTYFLAGGDIPLQVIQKDDCGAIEHSSKKVDASKIRIKGLSDYAIVWMSNKGNVCIGGVQGFYKNITKETYAFPITNKASSLIRTDNGFNQYIVTMQGTGTVYDQYE